MTRQDFAQTLALQALAWLAADPERIGPFLAQSGIAAQELGAMATDPEFLAAVLDFLLGDEPQLLVFCEETGIDPADPARARAALPGGDVPFWT